MAFTLFDLTYRVASKLGVVREGTATGGTTTTLVDTNDRTEEDDYWNGGTAWILWDAGDAGAAPEKSYSVISDFDNGTATATLRTTIVAPAAGDKYAVGKVRYPLWLLIQKINEAVEGVGEYPVTDKATITTASAQTEYSLPAAANRNLLRVSLQTKLSDTNDYQWVPISSGEWTVERTAIGTADLLIIPKQLPTGRLLKLEYGDVHAQLRASTDNLSETIHHQRVVTLATIKCLLHRKQKGGGRSQRALNEQLNTFLNELQMWETEEPIRKPQKSSRYLVMGRRVPADRFTYPDPA